MLPAGFCSFAGVGGLCVLRFSDCRTTGFVSDSMTVPVCLALLGRRETLAPLRFPLRLLTRQFCPMPGRPRDASMKVGVGGVPSTHSRGRRRQRRARGAGVRGDGGAHWAQRRRLRRLGRKPVLPRCPGGGASRWGGRTGSEAGSARARRPAGSLKRLSGAGRQGRRRREEPARASDLIRAAANHILHVRGGRAVHGVHSLLHGRPLDPLIFVARVAGQDGAADGARASRGGAAARTGAEPFLQLGVLPGGKGRAHGRLHAPDGPVAPRVPSDGRATAWSRSCGGCRQACTGRRLAPCGTSRTPPRGAQSSWRCAGGRARRLSGLVEPLSSAASNPASLGASLPSAALLSDDVIVFSAGR